MRAWEKRGYDSAVGFINKNKIAMSKLFYIDVETTGTNPKKHGLIQIAGIIEIDGREEERINLLVSPFEGDVIEDEALEVIGKDEKVLWSYEKPKIIYDRLIGYMEKYVDRYDRTDKFHFIGYNSRFDDSFIRSWFRKLDDVYYGSWFYWPAIDVSNLAAVSLIDQRSAMPNFKLMTVADYLGIDVDPDKAHDALYDVEITRLMHKTLTS